MKENKVFDVIPEIEDLINFAQFETDIECPTKQGNLNIRMAVLWEGDQYQIFKKSGEIHNPIDELSRARYMKIETLVQSIQKIGDKEYKSDDRDKNEVLKNELRDILEKSNPYVVLYLYETYVELINHSKVFVDNKIEKIKKKFQERIKNLKPL